ncbi:MAG: CDP-alcohol phosphatidyltransferase family protein [bacterium]|nr:CDP-alcohol phosphatidyltransferase family protein [bacterium]
MQVETTIQAESDRFWTASNVVSLFRLVLTVPVVYLLLNEMRVAAFIVCVVSAFTDYLDGRLARSTNTVSEWGKIVDPVADKVFIGAILVVLLVQGLYPVWFVVVVLARDVVIIAGGLYLRRITPVVPPSLTSGKWAVAAISATGFCAMMLWIIARDVFIVVSCILIAVSLWDYGRRFYGILRQNQENILGRNGSVAVRQTQGRSKQDP